MGHLPIVSLDTVSNVIKSGYISTRGDIGVDGAKKRPLIEKTIADIFSDMLAARKGDPIFPWIVKGKTTPNVGFKFEFQVSGKPIFIQGDHYPVKLPLEEEYLEYSSAVTEEEALDLFETKLLWNAIGKKSLGRGRSLTHQTPQEDITLRSKLGNSTKQSLTRGSFVGGVPLTIDLSQSVDNLGSYSGKTGIWRYPSSDRLRNLDLKKIQWTVGDKVKAEKVLEAWLMEHIDDVKSPPLQAVIPKDCKIKWFSNYLPFGVTGRNIDAVILCERDKELLAIVIELKKDGLQGQSWDFALKEAHFYAKFISRAIFHGEDKKVYPAIIAHSTSLLDAKIRTSSRGNWINETIFAQYQVRNGTAEISLI